VEAGTGSDNFKKFPGAGVTIFKNFREREHFISVL
jgi:hypothetical protein